MAYDVPVTHRKCATCRWWSGSRDLVFVGSDPKFVRIGGIHDAVSCDAWPDKKRGGADTCFRWSKWERL